jgi:hypothetical protein
MIGHEFREADGVPTAVTVVGKTMLLEKGRRREGRLGFETRRRFDFQAPITCSEQSQNFAPSPSCSTLQGRSTRFHVARPFDEFAHFGESAVASINVPRSMCRYALAVVVPTPAPGLLQSPAAWLSALSIQVAKRNTGSSNRSWCGGERARDVSLGANSSLRSVRFASPVETSRRLSGLSSRFQIRYPRDFGREVQPLTAGTELAEERVRRARLFTGAWAEENPGTQETRRDCEGFRTPATSLDWERALTALEDR